MPPQYTTHALVLGFKHSHLKDDIIGMARTMREDLNWRTCLYWLDDVDLPLLNQKLTNMIGTLRSNIQHANEKIIIYFGGCISYDDEATTNLASQCGMMWYASPPVNQREICRDCSMRVDPSVVFRQLLELPNDTYFIHGQWNLLSRSRKQWLRSQTHKPSFREREAYILSLGAQTMQEFQTPEDEEPCDCGSRRRWQIVLPTLPTFETSTLAEMLKTLPTPALDLTNHEQSDYSIVNLAGSYTPSLPASSPTNIKPSTQTQQPKPPYKAVHAIMIRWQGGDFSNEQSDTILQKALEDYLNYQIHFLDIPGDDNDDEAAYAGVDGTLGRGLLRLIREHGKPEDFLIVHYSGHGGVSDLHEGTLKGTRFSDEKLHLDLSRIQGLLRDRCQADVLLILNCCAAGFLPLASNAVFKNIARQSPHTMETLAACPPKGSTLSGPVDFSCRLAAQLVLHADVEERVSVDELNTLMVHDWRYRYTIFGGTYGENMRLLNCGKGSIVLRRIARPVERA